MPVELILLALSPVFIGFIAWEWYRSHQAANGVYRWQDSLANAVLALLHQGSDMLALLLLMPFFLWLHQFRLFDIDLTAATVALAFLLQDFLYYWFHRASHHIRWLWASHVAHHSSRQMNFSTALRQSLTYPLSGMWLFWTPMILLGFTPALVFAVVALNLAFQFFVHTQAVKRLGWLGWLEWLFNTPSHHRVHHACNAVYIDKNFAGVLVIWDRLFGTFVAERADEPCRYGITEDFNSDNPLTITFYEWRKMLSEALKLSSVRQLPAVLFGAPKKAGNDDN
ncbi:MAG: sterol desaturase family protein [Gammaproteobacteria bacterium]|nr:sterol desaturase family protein [Gammaproteobacteria bacterium]MBU1554349.1 sterol desaturase family protein [Gammaproteobacteria bacterium]MBU2069336.1 sterol desaturase family protein [Gammaproteobacteria bacterium]MBU2183389.1 sterol desaturase family protein [Gammaproteobacteria bacterium]MBU2204546.1 sterol desaturase family protein [Gammaproteobacteria bacterium]